MKNIIFLLLLTPAIASASVWTEFSSAFGSNDFTRTDATIAVNISTMVLGGLNMADYKRAGLHDVFSLRTPFNFFVSRSSMFTLKPFYYPKNELGSAAGAKASFSLGSNNKEKETSLIYTFSIAHEKQSLTGFSKEKASALSGEFQLEKNFYDQFFFLASASAVKNSKKPAFSQKRLADISDIISLNSYAFFNDVIYSRFGAQFARSFMPDFDSYLYVGADRISAYLSDYNSYTVGLRINFQDKNFLNFSYNYLDAKKGGNKAFYKATLGIFFK